MSFDEIARVIETAVVSDSIDVLSQLRVNLALMWPSDADAELLGRVISRRLERLGQAGAARPSSSDVVVLNLPTREPSMVRPMGVPDVLDGLTLRFTPWTAERVPAAAEGTESELPARLAWKVRVADTTLPPLGEPDGGLPRGGERAAILRHIGVHRPDL